MRGAEAELMASPCRSARLSGAATDGKGKLLYMVPATFPWWDRQFREPGLMFRGLLLEGNLSGKGNGQLEVLGRSRQEICNSISGP